MATRRRRLSGRIVALGRVEYRTCLCCNRNFLSEGPWNRFCTKCTRKRNRYGRIVRPVKASSDLFIDTVFENVKL